MSRVRELSYGRGEHIRNREASGAGGGMGGAGWRRGIGNEVRDSVNNGGGGSMGL